MNFLMRFVLYTILGITVVTMPITAVTVSYIIRLAIADVKDWKRNNKENR